MSASSHLRLYSQANKTKVLKPLCHATTEAVNQLERELSSVYERLTRIEAQLKMSSASQSEEVVMLTESNINMIQELERELKENIELEKEYDYNDENELEDEEDLDDCLTVATEEGVQIFKENPELRQCGTWSVEDEICNGCIKTKTKAYKKQKIDREKEKKNQIKLIQKEKVKIVKAEQHLLKKKLNDIKKGRTADYSDEERRQDLMKAKLRELAKSTTIDSNSHFSINLLVN